MGRQILKWLGLGSFYLYLASLFGLGLLGLLAPGFELESFYGLDFDSWPEEATATLFHQYRILKAFVLGFAVFGWVFRAEILSVRKYNYLFLFLMFTESLARPLSLLVDGRPIPKLLGFLVVEFFLAFAILAYTRTRLEQ